MFDVLWIRFVRQDSVCVHCVGFGSFYLIRVCLTHGMDVFLKNVVGSSVESIRMKVNVMGDEPA